MFAVKGYHAVVCDAFIIGWCQVYTQKKKKKKKKKMVIFPLSDLFGDC